MKVEAIFNEKRFQKLDFVDVTIAAKNPAHFRSAKSDKP
jgi:hypothetical protein